MIRYFLLVNTRFSFISIIIVTPWEFFISLLADGLSLEFKWQQVSSISKTLQSILGDLYNAVNWMVSTCLLISKSSSLLINPIITVPRTPITVTFMFHSFFNYLARSRYLSFFSDSFWCILWSARTTKSTILQILFFFVDYYKVWVLAGIRWSVCMLKSHRGVCVWFFRTGAGLCIYHLFVW